MPRSLSRGAPQDERAATRLLPVVVLLFGGSGCAALIYQIVWLQLLQLVVGSTAVSLGVLLATFMGGMCLGSALLPRLVGRTRPPLEVYAWLELALAGAAVIIFHAMPAVNSLYTITGGGTAVRAVIAAICLLPPTMMIQRIRSGAPYPAVLLTAAEDDPDVPPFHARKAAAALQAAAPNDRPVLLRIDRPAPDGAALLDMELRDVVDQRLFLNWQLGAR